MIELFERNKTEDEVNLLSPLIWAYIGDCVYETFIRLHLVNESNEKPNKLHIKSIKYVQARSQADALDLIFESLSEKEREIVRRGRNVQNHHVAKNASVAEYAKSTSFEGLIGYLYLTRQDTRLKEIFDMIINKSE